MTWTHRTENLCKAHRSGAWLGAMRWVLMSLAALAMLLATEAVAEESSPTPPVDEAREREKLARDLADLAQQHRPPRGAPMPGQQCAPRHVMVKGLKAQYGEDPIAYGIHPDGLFLLEIYVSPDSGTFTVLVTIAQTRVSCVSAIGEHWEMGSAALAPGQSS